MMKPRKLSRVKVERVLAICAHDDDEVIGPGGTLRALADAGSRPSTCRGASVMLPTAVRWGNRWKL